MRSWSTASPIEGFAAQKTRHAGRHQIAIRALRA
jgi:hypothetical protein